MELSHRHLRGTHTMSTSTDLTVLIGAPGSGKSTHAARRAGRDWAYLIASDAIRRELYGDENHGVGHNPEVFNLLYRRVRDHLAAGAPVLVDATNSTVEERAALLAIAAETGSSRIEAVVMRTPLGICLARNSSRGRVVPADVLAEMWTRIDRLTTADLLAEGFGTVVVHDSEPTGSA